MSSDSEESDLSYSDDESDLEGLFSDTESEEDEDEDFPGFIYELPEQVDFVKDEDGTLTKTYRNVRQQPRVFDRNQCGPVIGEQPGEGKALDFFGLFLADELIAKIVRWTNRSAVLKGVQNFVPTVAQEIKAYFALLFAMNRDVNLPRFENYFRKDERKWMFLVPGFSRVFTQKRFQQLNRYIFFSDPDNLNNNAANDKLIKVRPFIESFQQAFKENFVCGRAITIDECMVPFKGRLSIKQRMTSKPVRWGIKIFELCDSETAYLSRFEVYLGKERGEQQPVSDVGKCGAVVVKLAQDFQGKGHHLYIDNWFNSVALCHFLQARGIYICGTMRSNRKKYPTDLKALKASKMARGSSEIRTYNGIVAMAWKDTKLVHFLSTIHTPDQVSIVQRNKRTANGGYEALDIPAHAMIDDYNANMGGVDRNDQLTSIVKNRKQMRWYMRLVIKCLELAAYNAYVVEGFFMEHCIPGERKRDFAAFREELIIQLVGTWRTERTKPGRKRSSEDPLRLEGVGQHFPAKGTGTDHTCEVCREKRRRFVAANPEVPKPQVPHKMTKTTFKCELCDAYLCISRDNNCFKAWHSKVEFWR